MEKTKRNWLITGILAVAMIFSCMLGPGINNTVQIAYATGPENVAASELQIVLHRNDHSTDSTTFAGGKYLHINPAYETLETNSSSAGADMEYDASTGVLKINDTDNIDAYDGKISLYGLNSSDKQLTIEYHNIFDFYVLAFEKGNLTLENVTGTDISIGWRNKFKINGEFTIRGNTSVNPYLAATGYNYDVNNIIEAGTLKLLGNSSLYYTADSSDDIFSIVYVNSLVLNTDGVLYLDAEDATLKNNGKVLYASDVTLTKVKKITLVSPDNYDTTLTNSTYLRNAPTSPIPGYYSVIIQEGDYGDYIKKYYLVSDSTYFTVSFNKNGGTGTMAPVQNVNGTFVLPECTFAPPTGYGDLEFQYWADKSYGGNTFAEGDSYTLVGNIIFYARWRTAQNHTVSFNANGGTGSMAGGSYLGAYTLPACTITAPSGKQFKRWALGSADSTTQFNAGDTYYLHKDVTFYPVWEDAPEVNALTGTVTVTGTLKYGEVLTASVTGSNNTGTFSYQWQRNGANIAEATNSTYTLTAEDVGKIIKVIVTSSVETGEIYYQTVVTIDKANGPVAPTGITATACTTADNNDGTITGVTTAMEYKLSTATDWTAGTGETITGLANGTYLVRVKETATHNAGEQATVVVNAYNAPAEYSITVNYGTASTITATAGTTITLTANAPEEGYEFDKWTGVGVTFANENNATTTFVMPAGNVTITATYKLISVEPEPEVEPQPEPQPIGLSAGAIVGIILAVVVVGGVGGFAIFWFVVKKKTWADFVALFKKK